MSDIIVTLLDIILTLAKMMFDLLFIWAGIYLIWKFIRGYDLTISIKTEKKKKETDSHTVHI